MQADPLNVVVLYELLIVLVDHWVLLSCLSLLFEVSSNNHIFENVSIAILLLTKTKQKYNFIIIQHTEFVYTTV